MALDNPLDAYGATPKLRELRDTMLFGELQAHISRALTNGVTREEISEVITHVALYAGWPAGVSGSMMAMAAFEKEDSGD
jgi:alkylhydroperoxidase/carboxymuconolactone decarboxylase family protein YurZ